MRVRAVAFAAVVVVSIAGCGADADVEGFTVDSPVVEGLPVEAVTAALADPVFIADLNNLFSESERPGVLQVGIATDVFCRDLLHNYQEWVTTGQKPQVPDVARPAHPEATFDDALKPWVDMTRHAIDSGDPEELHAQLLAGGGCPNVVVDPASGSHTTVADVLGR